MDVLRLAVRPVNRLALLRLVLRLRVLRVSRACRKSACPSFACPNSSARLALLFVHRLVPRLANRLVVRPAIRLVVRPVIRLRLVNRLALLRPANRPVVRLRAALLACPSFACPSFACPSSAALLALRLALRLVNRLAVRPVIRLRPVNRLALLRLVVRLRALLACLACRKSAFRSPASAFALPALRPALRLAPPLAARPANKFSIGMSNLA